MLKVYQISANLVHRELRNETFEGKKIATSIKRPDSEYKELEEHAIATEELNGTSQTCFATQFF